MYAVNDTVMYGQSGISKLRKFATENSAEKR